MFEGLIISGLAGLISGFLGSSTSPQEEEVRKIMDKLYNEVDWIKQLPFSKEELLQGILPQVQKTFRGAADVAAGKIGATIPEVSGAPQGQSFMEYYTQALASASKEQLPSFLRYVNKLDKVLEKSKSDVERKGNFRLISE